MGEDTTTITIQFIAFGFGWLCILAYLVLALWEWHRQPEPRLDTDDAIPLAPGEMLPPEVFTDIVSFQVHQVLVSTGWSRPVETQEEVE